MHDVDHIASLPRSKRYGTRQWMVMDNSSMYMLIWMIVGGVWEMVFRFQRKLHRNKIKEEMINSGDSFDVVMERQKWNGCCQGDVGRVLVKSSLWVFCASFSWVCLMNDMAGCNIGGGETIFLLGVMPPLFSLLGNWWWFHNNYELNERAYHCEHRKRYKWREGM